MPHVSLWWEQCLPREAGGKTEPLPNPHRQRHRSVNKHTRAPHAHTCTQHQVKLAFRGSLSSVSNGVNKASQKGNGNSRPILFFAYITLTFRFHSENRESPPAFHPTRSQGKDGLLATQRWDQGPLVSLAVWGTARSRKLSQIAQIRLHQTHSIGQQILTDHPLWAWRGGDFKSHNHKIAEGCCAVSSFHTCSPLSAIHSTLTEQGQSSTTVSLETVPNETDAVVPDSSRGVS